MPHGFVWASWVCGGGRVRRYPLAALVDASGLSEAALGRAVGLSGTTLKNARVRGFLEASADRYAVRAGFHPAEVWPDFGCEPCALERVFVATRRGLLLQPGCDVMFRPHRAGHIYHDRKCARKAWARTAEGKRSLAEAKARWLEAAWEYDRKRERERKRAIREAAKNAACPSGSPQDTDGEVAA